jgi:hypothetical protein
MGDSYLEGSLKREAELKYWTGVRRDWRLDKITYEAIIIYTLHYIFVFCTGTTTLCGA